MKLLLVFAALLVAVAAEEYQAIVLLQGPNNRFYGNISFSQTAEGQPVRIYGSVSFLTAGKHGFHVHEKGDITGGCMSTKGHFNPSKKNHGAPQDQERHVGDLGNIVADDKGVAHVDFTDDVITLCSGPNSIIGRGLVIHSDADDLGKGGATDSLTTGNAGKRIACGVIGVQSPTGSWNSASSVVSSVVTVVAAVSVLLLRN